MIEWKPIESAPKDGTIILVLDDFGDASVAKHNYASELFVCMADGQCAHDAYARPIITLPTHWAEINLPERNNG